MRVTALRQAASRQNGSRSRGPITPAGKARSAQNARRHGMRTRTGSARIMPVDPESHSLRRATLHRGRPRTPAARLLAEALAVARWDLIQLDCRLDVGTNEPDATPSIDEPSPRERLAWLLDMADDTPKLAMAFELLVPPPGDLPTGSGRLRMNEPARPPPLNRHQRRALAARRRG